MLNSQGVRLFVAISIVCGGVGAWNHLQPNSEDWHGTTATILESKRLETQTRRDGKYHGSRVVKDVFWVVSLRYQYGGESHRARERSATEQVVGSEVTIYVNPDAPSSWVWQPSSKSVIGYVGWYLTAAGLAAFAIWGRRNPPKKARQGRREGRRKARRRKAG